MLVTVESEYFVLLVYHVMLNLFNTVQDDPEADRRMTDRPICLRNLNYSLTRLSGFLK